MRADVLVIGGGMAGVMAALAAREAGRTVGLVRRAPGATALSSGAVDVAPEPASGTASVAACVEAVAARRPLHPYAVLGAAGRKRLPEALSFASERLVGAGVPLSHFDLSRPGRRLISLSGKVRAVAGAMAWQATFDLRSAASAKVGVLELMGQGDLDVGLLVRGLAAAGVGHEVLRVDWPSDEDAAFLLPVDLARLLDNREERERFIAKLQEAVAGRALTHLWLPPVAGLREKVVALVAGALGLHVVEGLGEEASVPGLRLHLALERALREGGVELLTGTARLVEKELILTRGRETRPLQAGAVVLATGGFLGGGIARQGNLREGVFGLPVYVGDRLVRDEPVERLTNDDLFAPQGLFGAGVAADARLRALDETGRPAREGLFAAGEVLRGYDPSRDATGLGVAILTGYLAGRYAAGAE